MLEELRTGGVRTHEDRGTSGPLSGLRLLGPTDPALRCGTFSFVHDVLSPGEIVLALEEGFGVLARAGIHCAPRGHKTLGSLELGGAARMSLGPFVTADDVRTAVRGLREICAAVTPA